MVLTGGTIGHALNLGRVVHFEMHLEVVPLVTNNYNDNKKVR